MLTDGNIVTFAVGSLEFCERCKAEMEAMLLQRRTFYWQCRVEDAKHESIGAERVRAKPQIEMDIQTGWRET
jgi:hypothetical protein